MSNQGFPTLGGIKDEDGQEFLGELGPWTGRLKLLEYWCSNSALTLLVGHREDDLLYS